MSFRVIRFFTGLLVGFLVGALVVTALVISRGELQSKRSGVRLLQTTPPQYSYYYHGKHRVRIQPLISTK